MGLSLRSKFTVYLALVHLPFAGLAWFVLQRNPPLLLAVEGLFLVSFLVGLRMIRSLFGTLDLIRTGAQFIHDSDFGSRFREVGQPEMDQLVQVYNRMVDHLREERIRQEEQHYFLDKILKASPSGILTLDFDARIETINPAAARILGMAAPELVGRTLKEAAIPYVRALEDLRPGESKILTFSGGRRVKCQRSEFLDRGFPRPFVMLEELTEELRQSEKAAYERLIRMMSHEVNNSVGAARSLLESCLNYKGQIQAADREDFETALRVVLARTSELNAFMRGFSDVVRIPAPKLQPVDVRSLLIGIAALFRAESERRRIAWIWEGEDGAPGPVPMDRGQMEQVFVNVVKNAMEAIGEDGTITVRIGREGGRPRVAIEDTGCGLTPDVCANLFMPFFSTKQNGQGIGLTVVQEILSRHRFEFSLDGGPDRPTQFSIYF